MVLYNKVHTSYIPYHTILACPVGAHGEDIDTPSLPPIGSACANVYVRMYVCTFIHLCMQFRAFRYCAYLDGQMQQPSYGL